MPSSRGRKHCYGRYADVHNSHGAIPVNMPLKVRAYGCMWGSFFWFRIAMVVPLTSPHPTPPHQHQKNSSPHLISPPQHPTPPRPNTTPPLRHSVYLPVPGGVPQDEVWEELHQWPYKSVAPANPAIYADVRNSDDVVHKRSAFYRSFQKTTTTALV